MLNTLIVFVRVLQHWLATPHSNTFPESDVMTTNTVVCSGLSLCISLLCISILKAMWRRWGSTSSTVSALSISTFPSSDA